MPNRAARPRQRPQPETTELQKQKTIDACKTLLSAESGSAYQIRSPISHRQPSAAMMAGQLSVSRANKSVKSHSNCSATRKQSNRKITAARFLASALREHNRPEGNSSKRSWLANVI